MAQDTITVWPGQGGWDLIEELDDIADESSRSRNELILDAIEVYLGVHEVLEDTEVWEEANRVDRKVMLRQALRDYRDSW